MCQFTELLRASLSKIWQPLLSRLSYLVTKSFIYDSCHDMALLSKIPQHSQHSFNDFFASCTFWNTYGSEDFRGLELKPEAVRGKASNLEVVNGNS